MLPAPHNFYAVFESGNHSIVLDDPIEEHIAWLYQHVMQYSYPPGYENHAGLPVYVPREVHGIADAARCSYLAKVVLELFRRYHDENAIQIDAPQLKLMEITAAFHDTGRSDDGKDTLTSESRSANYLYLYLTKILGIAPATACLYARSIYYKDGHRMPPKECLLVDVDAKWEESDKEEEEEEEEAQPPEEGLLFHVEPYPDKDSKEHFLFKWLHDIDCFDVIRARTRLKLHELHLFKMYCGEDQPTRRDEIAFLTTQISSWIASHGDSFLGADSKLKTEFDQADAYERVRDSAAFSQNTISLHKLYNQGVLLSLDALAQITIPDRAISEAVRTPLEIELTARLLEGRLLGRGINFASALLLQTKSEKPTRTAAEFEIYKMRRAKGNPYRSFALLGFQGRSFSAAGFLVIIDSKRKYIPYDADVNTRFGKKTEENLDNLAAHHRKTIDQLFAANKFGERNISDGFHNEVIYSTTTIEDIVAIFFSNDPVESNARTMEETREEGESNFCAPSTPEAPLLQAYYIKKEYEHLTGKRIAVVEYSSIHGYVKETNLDDRQFAEQLKLACKKWLQDRMDAHYADHIAHLTLKEIKSLAVYGTSTPNYRYNPIYICILDIDRHLSPELQAEINAFILEQQEEITAACTQVHIELLLETPTIEHYFSFSHMRCLLAAQLPPTVVDFYKLFCDQKLEGLKDSADFIRASNAKDIDFPLHWLDKNYYPSRNFLNALFPILISHPSAQLFYGCKEFNSLLNRSMFSMEIFRVFYVAKCLGLHDILNEIKCMVEMSIDNEPKSQYSYSYFTEEHTALVKGLFLCNVFELSSFPYFFYCRVQKEIRKLMNGELLLPACFISEKEIFLFSLLLSSQPLIERVKRQCSCSNEHIHNAIKAALLHGKIRIRDPNKFYQFTQLAEQLGLKAHFDHQTLCHQIIRFWRSSISDYGIVIMVEHRFHLHETEAFINDFILDAHRFIRSFGNKVKLGPIEGLYNYFNTVKKSRGFRGFSDEEMHLIYTCFEAIKKRQPNIVIIAIREEKWVVQQLAAWCAPWVRAQRKSPCSSAARGGLFALLDPKSSGGPAGEPESHETRKFL